MTYQFAPAHRVVSSRNVTVQSADPLVTRLSSLAQLTPEQARIVSAIQGPPRSVPAHSQLADMVGSTTATLVIREGWAFAYTLLDGGERQVIGFLLPGDVVFLGCAGDEELELGVETITDVVVTAVLTNAVHSEAQTLAEVFVLFWRLQSKAVFGLVGQLTDLGRRDARARLAQLLLKLERRLAPIGLTDADGYDCPLSQYLIADALGLTPVHVNRVLKGLREDGVVTVRNNRVTIHDRVRLKAIAGADGPDSGNGDGAMQMGDDNRRRAVDRVGNERAVL